MDNLKKMMEEMEFKLILSKLGYDVTLAGYIFFEELVFEVREMLNDGKTEKEVNQMIPSLITEYGSCYHEVGRKKYLKAIDEFFSKRKPVDLNEENAKELEIINLGTNLNEKVLVCAKAIIDKPKVKVKTKNESM